MTVLLGVPCESCGYTIADPMDRIYDPETSTFLCRRCALLEDDTRAEETLINEERARHSEGFRLPACVTLPPLSFDTGPPPKSRTRSRSGKGKSRRVAVPA